LKAIASVNLLLDAMHYGAYEVMIWVFAFKYWVVSVEMPKAIDKVH